MTERLSLVVLTFSSLSVTLFDVAVGVTVGVSKARFIFALVVNDASDSSVTDVHVAALGAVISIRASATYLLKLKTRFPSWGFSPFAICMSYAPRWSALSLPFWVCPVMLMGRASLS